jgi:hypothetical protein
MDTIEDSNCDHCARPVDTGECRCDVPDWFSVDVAINIKLRSTERNATDDALGILNCEHTKTNDYEFYIADLDVELLGDPRYVP